MDTNGTGADAVKRRISQRVAAWNQNSPLPGFTLGLSIGIQEFDGTRSFDQVLAEADLKMYAEKKNPLETDRS